MNVHVMPLAIASVMASQSVIAQAQGSPAADPVASSPPANSGQVFGDIVVTAIHGATASGLGIRWGNVPPHIRSRLTSRPARGTANSSDARRLMFQSYPIEKNANDG